MIFQRAPFDCHSMWWKGWQKKFGGPGMARAALVANIAFQAARDCEELYGADHPCVERFRAPAGRRR